MTRVLIEEAFFFMIHEHYESEQACLLPIPSRRDRSQLRDPRCFEVCRVLCGASAYLILTHFSSLLKYIDR